MKINDLPGWTEFKATCIVKKNLNCQYTENDTRYELEGPEGPLLWLAILPKSYPRSADQVEFEDVYKAAFNFPIGDRAYAFSTADFVFDGDGVYDVCTAAGTKSIDYQISATDHPVGQNINGAIVLLESSILGDWVEFIILDKSNLLPAPMTGADLSQWVKRWYVPACPAGSQTVPVILQTPYSGRVPAGMWLRIIYHSTGSTNVKIGVNYFLHSPA